MNPLFAAFMQFLTKPKVPPAGADETAGRARVAAAVYATKPKGKTAPDAFSTILTGPSGLANPLPSGSKTLLGM